MEYLNESFFPESIRKFKEMQPKPVYTKDQQLSKIARKEKELVMSKEFVKSMQKRFDDRLGQVADEMYGQI